MPTAVQDGPAPRHASAEGSEACETGATGSTEAAAGILCFWQLLEEIPLLGDQNNPPALCCLGLSPAFCRVLMVLSPQRAPHTEIPIWSKKSESEPSALPRVYYCPLGMTVCYLHLLLHRFPRETSNRKQRCAFRLVFSAFSAFSGAGRL